MRDTLDQLIAEILDLDMTQVTDDLSPESAARWDSLNHLRLITAVEHAFEIRLSMHEIMSISNVARLRELIATHAMS